jgi:hypothetical protein
VYNLAFIELAIDDATIRSVSAFPEA